MKLKEILLVDDSDLDNFVHQRVLKTLDVAERVTVAENGQEALEYLEQVYRERPLEVPELIFLDINMPIMDGWEFIEAVRGSDIISNTVIVTMLTTSTNPDDRAKAEESNKLQGFLTKPLTAASVEKVLKEYFSE